MQLSKEQNKLPGAFVLYSHQDLATTEKKTQTPRSGWHFQVGVTKAMEQRIRALGNHLYLAFHEVMVSFPTKRPHEPVEFTPPSVDDFLPFLASKCRRILTKMRKKGLTIPSQMLKPPPTQGMLAPIVTPPAL